MDSNEDNRDEFITKGEVKRARQDKKNAAKKLKRAQGTGATGVKLMGELSTKELEVSTGKAHASDKGASSSQGLTGDVQAIRTTAKQRGGSDEGRFSSEMEISEDLSLHQGQTTETDPLHFERIRAIEAQLENLRQRAAEMSKLYNQFEENQGNEGEGDDDTQGMHQSYWYNRKGNLENEWKLSRLPFHEAKIKSHFPTHTRCTKCNKSINKFFVNCQSCKHILCNNCDLVQHALEPFHERVFIVRARSSNSMECCSFKLLPTSFVEPCGDLYYLKVPVPCVPPPKCPECAAEGSLALTAGRKKAIVINQRGRFDLSSAAFRCCDESCNEIIESTREDYVSNQYWPASEKSSYLVDEKVLESWYHIRNLSPGTSEKAFVEHLERLSQQAGRSSIINKVLFGKASREYEYCNFKMEKDVLNLKRHFCDACGDSPLASHLDGNMKLKRFHKNNARNESADVSLYGDEMIAKNSDVKSHTDKINCVLGQSSGSQDTCGGNVFKAASQGEKSSRNDKLDERGIVVSCCRHGVILRAADIFLGENYRIIHFLHSYLLELNVEFLCYDVVCSYWDWAVKLERMVPEFEGMTEKSKAFLSRMHAVAHVWYCYILWVGHWKKGAAGTIGEEMEQVNADISQLSHTTKHMTRAGRIDVLTSHFMYWNAKKDENLPKMLIQRLWRARTLYPSYKEQLKELLRDSGLEESDLPKVLQDLEELAGSAKRDQRSRTKGPISTQKRYLEGLFVEFISLKRMYEKSADGSKARVHASTAMSKTKKKAQRLIDDINALQDERTEELPHDVDLACDNSMQFPAETGSLPCDQSGDGLDGMTDPAPQKERSITMIDFLNGEFPWQTGDQDEYRRNHRLVDTWMLRDRYKEEISQLEKEMVQYVNSKNKTIELLEGEIQSLRSEIGEQGEENRILLGKHVMKANEKRRLTLVVQSAADKFQAVLHGKLEDPSSDNETEDSDIEGP